MIKKVAVVISIALSVFASGCLQLRIVQAVDPEASQVGSDPSVSDYAFSISQNFQGATGYTLSGSGASATTFAVTKKPAKGKVECRAGLKRSIASVSWSDCSSGKVINASAAGFAGASQSGTFVAEARGVDSKGNVVTSISKDYYVHPSLNGAVACNPSMTEDQIFQAAGALLDQSDVFGSGSTFQSPAFHIESADGRAVDFHSFRKRIVMNGAKTLILVRRRYASAKGDCDFNVGNASYRYKTVTVARPNGDMFYANSQFTWDHGGFWTNSGNYTSTNTNMAASNPTGWADFQTQSHFSVDHWYRKRNALWNQGEHCSALVLNARGRGVCIEAGTGQAFNLAHIGVMANFRDRGTRMFSQKVEVASTAEATSLGADASLRKQVIGWDPGIGAYGPVELYKIYFED